MKTKLKQKRRLIKRIIFYASLFIIPGGLSNAQNAGYSNPKMMQIAKPSSKTGWIDFRNEISINPNTVFIDYREAFGLGTDDEMRIAKVQNDNLGFTHYRYQQYYRGIKVEGAEYIVHQNNEGIVYCANGKMVNGLNQPTVKSLNENAALEKAKIASGAKGFLWENANAEHQLQSRKKLTAATYFPKGELVWCKPGDADEFEARNFHLCWKFDINTDGSAPSLRMFVDAQTGEVINQMPLDLNCNTGTGTTTFNGTQTIWTSTSGGNYILDYDCSNYSEIHAYDAHFSQTTGSATEYTDVDNNWTSTYQQMGVQSLFSIRAALKFYKDVFTRDGYDNSNSTVEVYNNSLFPAPGGGLTNSNASWSQSEEIMRVGTGPSSLTTDDLNTVDILGHELTHAVTQYSAALAYQKQSGALNESFSDILGESVENYTLGTNDWLMGGELSTGAIRSLANPWLGNQPKYYGDSLWVTTNCSPALANDFCGVHTNSGVQNFWFYLLSVGGSGTNHNNRSYSVSGIGISKARGISYRNLTAYLTSNATYADAREGAIRSAEDLYGSCSNEAIQCGNAWFACEVGTSLTNFNETVCGVYPVLGFIDEHYYAINTITSGGSGCATTITPSTYSVNYHAKTYVSLKAGFIAQNGSHFTAFIDPCGVTSYKLASQNQNSSNAENQLSEEHAAVSPKQNNVTVFPNPFKNSLSLTINLEDAAQVTFRIYDVVGKELYNYKHEEQFEEGSNTYGIDTGDLSAGVYFVTVDDGINQQKIKVTKIE